MSRKRTNTTFFSAAKKLGIILLFAGTGMGAFATLGDGNKNPDKPSKPVMSGRSVSKPGTFSLKSGYNYRGSTVLSPSAEKTTIRLNTVGTVQKGKTTFIVPLRKNVVINKVKLDLGNRQFQH